MAEYNFSPEALEHYVAAHPSPRISNWTKGQHVNPFQRPHRLNKDYGKPSLHINVPASRLSTLQSSLSPTKLKQFELGSLAKPSACFLSDDTNPSQAGAKFRNALSRRDLSLASKLDNLAMPVKNGPYSNPKLDPTVDPPSFAVTDPYRTNLRVVPADPLKMRHKFFPHAPVHETDTVTTTSLKIPVESSSKLNDISPRRSNILYPWQTSLNDKTDLVYMDPFRTPRHCDTNAQSKSHVAANQHSPPPTVPLPPDPGPFPIPSQSEFVLPKGSLYRGSRYTSHNTIFQSSEVPVLNSIPGLPPQRQLQSESHPAMPSSGDSLNALIKEHAPFMISLSGVLGGVALNTICSDKTKGHPHICYALSTLRIYSLLLNLGAITILALLLLFIPQNGGNTRYLWFLWVGLILLDLILTFSQIVLFSWPEGVQVGVLVLIAAVCFVAGIVFCREFYATSCTHTDIEQANQ